MPRDFPELPSNVTIASTSRQVLLLRKPSPFSISPRKSQGVVSPGFPLLQPRQKLLQQLCFTSPMNMQAATDRCQIFNKNFALSKALDAQAHKWRATAFDSEDIHAQHQSFLLPAVHNYAPSGAQQDQACVAGSFQGWLQRVPQSSPASAGQYSCSFLAKCLFTPLQKQFSHEGQIAAGAYTAVWQGNK